MARHRRKTRTHVKVTEEEFQKVPRTMVISLGDALKSHSLGELVADVRLVMQPHTAINLRERKSNKLRDFVVMAGPLSVSHMLVFHQTDAGNVNLRLSRLPRGPTITFKVTNYSLCKDIRRILKTPKSISKDSKEFANPPLLVLNGFTTPAKAEPHEKLLVTLLQSMFPAITPQTLKVSGVKRVLMLNKNASGEIDLRHYSIDVKPVELSRSIRKLVSVKNHVNKRLPNMSKVSDIADFVSDPYANGAGFTSDSEIEDDAIVSVKEEEKVKKQVQTHKTKKAVKLTEIGPRLRLVLLKIEDDVTDGKVLYHSLVSKSEEEIKRLEKKHAVRRKLKEKRKKEQEKNVNEKKEKKEAKKLRRKMRQQGGDGEDSSENSEDFDGDVENSDNDAE